MRERESADTMIEEAWTKQENLQSAVKDAGGLEAYILEKDISIDAAFESAEEGKEKVCACIDEGVTGDIRMAGSGILHPGGIEEVAALLRKAGVTEVTSHEGCGAAALAKRDGKQWAEELAKVLGVPARHINKEAMKRPETFHDASAVYIHTTPSFNPRAVEGLPQGFVLSWSAMDREHAEKNAILAIDIALGEHGFGRRFTNESPFTVVAVGNPDDTEYKQLVACLPGLVARYGFRVKIDQITAPSLAAVENSVDSDIAA